MPDTTPTEMQPSRFIKALVAGGISAELLKPDAAGNECVFVKSEQIVSALALLKKDQAIKAELLLAVTGSDLRDSFELIYHLYSITLRAGLLLKVSLDHENPVAQSVTSVHSGASYHEREIFDLLGVLFTNHPNLKRILLPEHWKGHPLRKDYVMDDERLSWNAR